jgi:hypothetical protein
VELHLIVVLAAVQAINARPSMSEQHRFAVADE